MEKTEIKIPYGYKQVFGEARKGDGIYDYGRNKFAPAKKVWPKTGDNEDAFIIRRCGVTQLELIDAYPGR